MQIGATLLFGAFTQLRGQGVIEEIDLRKVQHYLLDPATVAPTDQVLAGESVRDRGAMTRKAVGPGALRVIGTNVLEISLDILLQSRAMQCERLVILVQ